MDMNEEKISGGGGGGVRSGWVGRVGAGQDGCERRSEVFNKIQKSLGFLFFLFFFGGGGRVWGQCGCERRSEIIDKKGGRVRGGRVVGQGGCERIIEVFVKIQKK